MNEELKNYIGQFINNGKINIDSKYWNIINKNYDKQDIIDVFIYYIMNKYIDLPMLDITLNEAINDFNNLRNYEVNPISISKLKTKFEYEKVISNKYISNSKIGNKASNYFHQYNRYKCESSYPSPYRTWTTESLCRSLLNSIWSLKHKKINSSTLRESISLRKYIASQFKPSAAKNIYNYFNSKIILDFSSGWGDRLCGFYATKNTNYYMGIDPNINLVEGYNKQIELYNNLINNKFSLFNNKNNKKADMICKAAEDVDYPNNYFDTIFTSPPYFNAEKYSNDDNQSYKRYKKINDWLEGFLFITLEKVWNSLKKDGYLIINISDIYTSHKIQKICDPMNDFIENKLKGKYIDCIGYKIEKRLNCNSIKDLNNKILLAEPIWIFRKEN